MRRRKPRAPAAARLRMEAGSGHAWCARGCPSLTASSREHRPPRRMTLRRGASCARRNAPQCPASSPLQSTSSACATRPRCDMRREMCARVIVFVDTLAHHTHSVMLRKQMHSDSHSRSLHRGAPRREGRSMDRMLVEAAPAVTTSPERNRVGNRSPVEMLCIDAGAARPAANPFPRAQAARWRRRGEAVHGGRACRFLASSKRSSCT